MEHNDHQRFAVKVNADKRQGGTPDVKSGRKTINPLITISLSAIERIEELKWEPPA